MMLMKPPDDLTFQLILMFAGVVLGQAVAMTVPVLIEMARLRRGPDIVGRWVSVYRPDMREETQLFREHIDVRVRRGRVVMTNVDHPTRDYYTVEARVINRTYVVGDWFSRKPGANASGAVLMTISPLGDMMYGYFTGLGNTGERTYCAWLMVREDADVARGLELARRLTMNFPLRSSIRAADSEAAVTSAK